MPLEDLRVQLQSRRTEDRIRAAERLDARHPGHPELLLALLDDRSPFVAGTAARKLAEDPPEGMERELLRVYQEKDAGGAGADPGCEVRMRLAIALGKLRYHPATDTLRQGLRTHQIEQGADTAVALRGNCALALSQLAPLDAARDIAILLFEGEGGPLDPTIPARKMAARALGRLGEQAALAPLAVKLTYPGHDDPDVLRECMDSVLTLEDPRALELFEPLLHHRDSHLAAQAALAIARTGDDRAGGLLLDACDRFRGDLLRAVALSLGAMRTDASQSALRELAQSVREDARMAATEALATAPDDETMALLTRMAEEDSSPRVREAARRAVRQ